MDVRWLETFAVAAREGSFSVAAGSLGYARSTVTHHIKSLERDLDAVLFDREVAGQPLTPNGLAMLEHAESILTQIALAREKLTTGGATARPVRLATTESTAAYRLALFLRGLQRHLPKVKVEVEVAPSVAAIRDLLRRGRCDVALISVAPTDVDEQLGSRHLWEEKPVMVGGPGAGPVPSTVLVTQRGCVYRDIVESEFLGTAPGVEVVQMGSVEAVKSGTLSGLGAGLLPMVAAGPHLRGGQLVPATWQPTRRVVTEARWNTEVCPAPVVAFLQRLATAAPAEV